MDGENKELNVTLYKNSAFAQYILLNIKFISKMLFLNYNTFVTCNTLLTLGYCLTTIS